MRYDPMLDLENWNRTHTKIFALVESGSEVLDVGCARGELGEALAREKGCTVTGIELDPEFAAAASGRLHRVVEGSAADGATWAALAASAGGAPESSAASSSTSGFDFIIFSDLLEHLPVPEKALRFAEEHLAPGGKIIVSLPNIATWRLRRELLLGRFEYTDEGIMDRTHLRFYTKRSAASMIESSGFRVVGFDFVVGPRVGRYLSSFKGIARRLPPTLAGTQFIFLVERREG